MTRSARGTRPGKSAPATPVEVSGLETIARAQISNKRALKAEAESFAAKRKAHDAAMRELEREQRRLDDALCMELGEVGPPFSAPPPESSPEEVVK